GKGDVRISMTVQLLFDKTDNSDAFLADKLNTSTSALAVNAAKAALTLTGMKDTSDYSVKGDVEAFLGALQQDKTREIAFCWGSLRYDGCLENVSARYTMFNPLGQPTRAEVNLSMICYGNYGLLATPASNWQVENKKMWDEAYNTTFENGSSSLTGIGQKVGSLLNVKL
ncbi:MAG: hypothetical protein LUH58_04865, partial [Lachnospiraceae bacterium]|nr:hypothetical protein [Lachnospiraceae bacterium]